MSKAKIYIILLVAELVFSLNLIQQLEEVISNPRGSFLSCPGAVFVVDDSSIRNNDRQEFIESFIRSITMPLVILQSESVLSSFVPEKYPRDIVCHYLFQFSFNLSDSSRVYQQLKPTYYLKNTIIFVSNQFSSKDGDVMLRNIQNEHVILIDISMDSLLDKFQVYQWRIDDQIHRSFSSLTSSFDYLSNTKTNNLNGRTLRLGTLDFPPAVFIGNTSDTTSKVDGVEPALMNLLADSLNFSMNYTFSNEDEMWGILRTLENGKVRLDGLRGMLHRREVDVAFGELYIFDRWMNYLSFSEAFKTNHECFLVPFPKPYARWMAVIFPFSLSTWIATLFSVIFAVLTLHVIARWTQNNMDSYLSDRILCVLYITGNLLNIQQPRGIQSAPNRLFMAAWLTAAAITSSAYCSGLISFLTHPSSPPPIQTIEQLTKSSFNKMIYTDFYVEILQNSSDPHRRLLGQQLIPTDNITYMFSVLDSGEWAVDSTMDRLLYEVEIRYPMRKQEDSPFYLMKECLYPSKSSFGLQKDSPLKSYFDRKILRFVETGLVKYHYSRFVKGLRELHRSPTSNDEMVPFSLHNLQGAFYLFIGGTALSTLVFVAEIMSVLFYEFHLNV